MLPNNILLMIDEIMNIGITYVIALAVLTLQGLEMNITFFALGYVFAETTKMVGKYLIKEWKALRAYRATDKKGDAKDGE